MAELIGFSIVGLIALILVYRYLTRQTKWRVREVYGPRITRVVIETRGVQPIQIGQAWRGSAKYEYDLAELRAQAKSEASVMNAGRRFLNE